MKVIVYVQRNVNDFSNEEGSQQWSVPVFRLIYSSVDITFISPFFEESYMATKLFAQSIKLAFTYH